ncbi:MAG: DNA topoisomerase VI subunit B [Acidobacteriota bacterium]
MAKKGRVAKTAAARGRAKARGKGGAKAGTNAKISTQEKAGTSKVSGKRGGRTALKESAGNVVQMKLFLARQGAGDRKAAAGSTKAARTKAAEGTDAPLPPAAGAQPPAGGRRTPPRTRATAESLGRRQREISVAEFFQKNRHLLGFDNPSKALLTATKEAVDNSLDACEEAGILPTLEIAIEEMSEDRFRLSITDNGPGIVRAQIPRIFGKLLYGSKFHSLKQARGQQGIGISAAGMYSQLTTGQPVRITSRSGRKKPAHYFEIQIDTAKNEPKVLTDREVEWEPEHGTKVVMDLAGTYKKGRRSVDDYIVQTALANPHADIHYKPPKGDEFHRERVSQELPREPQSIKPHPYGIELGALIAMLHETRGRSVKGALQADFSRVSEKVAEEICQVAGVNPNARPRKMDVQQVEALFHAISKVKIMNPPANCVVPIGEELIHEGLKKTVQAEFYASATRPPAVYRGNPFVVEVGLAYGGDLPGDELIDLWRFANRVPLQYQQSACAITRAAIGTDWRNYTMQQGKGALPTGAMILFVHVASVWVPFTSESKEAVASYPEIIRELRLGLQECGRRLGGFLRHRRRLEDAEKKKSYIQAYIPHIGIALKEILDLSDKDEAKIVTVLTDTLERTRKI